jgi:hypothetical protein
LQGYWHASPVHYYFDESGDFVFPEGHYDVYVQAALICPDSFVDKVEHYVDNFKRELGVDELHGAELPDEQLIEVCRFLGNGPLQLVGQATDTQVITDEQISVHREEQAVLLRQNLEQYKRAGGGWAGAEAWYTRHIKRAELASRVSNSEYIQTDMLVGLIHAALFKSRPFPRRRMARRPRRLSLHPRREAAGQAGAGREGPRRPACAAPWQQPLRAGVAAEPAGSQSWRIWRRRRRRLMGRKRALVLLCGFGLAAAGGNRWQKFPHF